MYSYKVNTSNGASYGQSYYRTVTGNQETVHSLSNGTIFDDLE